MSGVMERIFNPAVPVEMAARDAANPLIRAIAVEMLRIGLIPRDSDELGDFLSAVTYPRHPLLVEVIAVALPLVERRRAPGGLR